MHPRQYQTVGGIFIKNKANPNKTCLRESAMHFCIYLKRKTCLETLIKYGADVNKKCLGKSALDYAISKKDYETALYLLKQGALPSRYTYRKAKKAENIELKKYLGMNVN